MRPYVLAETNWRQVQETAYEVAVLPWGATEAHNYHLPYATDVYETIAIAEESAHIAWQAGAKVLALPAIPFGVNTGQLDIPLTINMNPSTQLAVLRDIVESLEVQGVPKLVVLNGHGGNDFRTMLRELQGATEVFICTLNWFTCIDARSFFDEPGDHAGELETSLMMFLQPDLVSLASAGDGRTRAFRVQALREGWVWAPREWRRATIDTGSGNPRAASPEKGERYFEAVTQKIGQFLVEIAQTPANQLYEGED
ncbi:MAG TPA: creatininase family protein [Longimicrobiales bacterium]|nr:creatininase family protein [Longimicrobiales bacterium]